MGALAVDAVLSGLTRVILVLCPTTPTEDAARTTSTVVAQLLPLVATERTGDERIDFTL